MKSVVLEEGFRAEPDTLNVYGENYGQYFRGYIRAPRTGNYKFYLASDDCSELWLSKTTKSQGISYPGDM